MLTLKLTTFQVLYQELGKLTIRTYYTKISVTKPFSPTGLECPSCRKMVCVDAVNTLPRNLALENIVIRYSEERSKSIRKSLSLESPVSDYLISPISDASDLPEFPTASRTECELCETQAPAKAAWYCVQCEVAYCHACFGKFHPRRGTLARHKVRSGFFLPRVIIDFSPSLYNYACSCKMISYYRKKTK